MTPPFTFASRLSRAKYASITLEMALRTNIFLLGPALVSAFYFLASLISLIAHPGDWGHQTLLASLVMFLPVLVLSSPLLYLLRKWYNFRFEYDHVYPQLRREIEFTFLEDGFVVRAPDGEAKIEWNEAANLYKAGGFFILTLRHDNGTYYIDARQLTRDQIQFIRTRFLYRFWQS